MSADQQPVRAAIIGCGAVAQLYYVPALRTLEAERRLAVTDAHDPNAAAVRTFCSTFPGARHAQSVDELLDRHPQLVIVASPPQHHAEQTIAALRAGADVHCEKPLALTAAEGERMVAVAGEVGRRLTVGLVRRHFPATQVIARLIAGGALGELRSVECFEGGPFDWPVASADYFRRSAGSGLLHDIGTHCVDLLMWWLGTPTDVTYDDDAMGGVEANCRLALEFGEVRATVRLSRDWARPNRYVITGTHGSIGWTVNDTDHVDLGLGRHRSEHPIAGDNLSGTLALHQPSSEDGAPGLVRPAATFDEAFANQLRVLTDSASDHCWVTGEQALPTMRIIDRCRAQRGLMSMPWLPIEEVRP